MRVRKKSRLCASPETYPHGAVACSSAELAGHTTSRPLPFPATLSPAMSPQANVIGKKTSSILPSKSPPAGRFKSLRRPDSAIMSAGTSSNAGPQKRKPGVRGERVNYKRLTLLVFLTCWTVALSARSQETSSLAPGEKPADAPPQWKEWIGEYGPDNFIYSVRESQGRIWISSSRGGEWQFTHAPIGRYEQAESANGMPLTAKFDRAANGVQSLITGDVAWSRRSYAVDVKNIAHIRPARSIEELRKEAFATSPPVESGSFPKPHLVCPAAPAASLQPPHRI